MRDGIRGDTATLAASVSAYFEDVHRCVFLGDPAANARLRVEVVEPTVVGDTPIMALITPWTLNGLAFPPDEDFPAELSIGGRSYPVLRNELEAFGPYHQVNLLSDVSALESQTQARDAALAFASGFRIAVEQARQRARVENPSRRRLLKGGSP